MSQIRLGQMRCKVDVLTARVAAGKTIEIIGEGVPSGRLATVRASEQGTGRRAASKQAEKDHGAPTTEVEEAFHGD